MRLEAALEQIEMIDEVAKNQCIRRWDTIFKPLHSLGKIEDGIAKIAGIMGTHEVKLDKKALVILCADNGVVAEGISQSGSEITSLVANNFLTMNSCACIMANYNGVDVFPIDIGMNKDTSIPSRKIGYGTKNMLHEPAMSMEQTMEAIEVGIDLVYELKEKGYQIIATGEMGIGNTTTSSAIASVLLEVPVEVVTGKGAGLSLAGLEHKIDVINRSIQYHNPQKDNPIDVLSKLGGYDIAGLVGLYIGGAAAKIPIIMDGFISSVAALIAIRLEPKVLHYILPSHVSKETAGKLLLDAIGVEPYLTCDMCLGEGTGAVSLFPLLSMGLEVYNKMSTFEQNSLEAYQAF